MGKQDIVRLFDVAPEKSEVDEISDERSDERSNEKSDERSDE
jgi:hypothetical protein